MRNEIMDWYIFLTPLLLLPIIFLFRLIGCGLDTTGGNQAKVVILTAKPISPITDHPISQLFVTFGVKGAIPTFPLLELVPVDKQEDVLESEDPPIHSVLGLSGTPEGTFSIKFALMADGMWCRPYVWIMRHGIAYDPDTQKFGTLLNPNQKPFMTLKDNLNLTLKVTDNPPTMDYLEENFDIIEDN
jgi:hypothetical protein